MNFVLVVCDTLRRDHLGCYGNEWISTPHVDRFAAESLTFLNAYSASFPTVPHRRDVLTGRYTAAYTPWAPLSADEVVLPHVLGQAGYASMMVCDCPHILENGYHYDRGFDGFEWIRGQESDRWRTAPEPPRPPCDPAKLRDRGRLPHRRAVAARRGEEETFVARTMTAACRWLEDNYRREPFFLYVDSFDPHEPWDAPAWYAEMYDPGYEGEVVDYPLYARADFLSEAELRHVRALYAAEVTLVDRWVGRLIEKIADMGLLGDTMVMLTTDHGFLHGEHGIMGKSLIDERRIDYVPLYEEINHIPLIVHFPGAGAGERAALVQPMDFMPTLLDLAGAERPERVQGRSLAEVLAGEDAHRDFAVSSPYVGGGPVPATVTCGRWSAVFWSAPRKEGPVVDKAVDGYEKEQAAVARDDMLFDLAADPAQERDICADRPEAMAELRERLLAFWREVGLDEAALARWQAP